MIGWLCHVRTWSIIYANDKLTLESVNITRQGTAVIRLRGSMDVANACDAARSRAQLQRTALQFPSVKRVAIYLNGTKF